MKLVFLGTRGYIEAKNRRHRRHTALMVSYRGRKILIDCGEDWLGRIDDLKPRAIVITHAHPDHAHGLKQGAPCPVYSTPEAWEGMKEYPIGKDLRHVIQAETDVTIQGITFRAYSVEHSLNCPAVGYRITAGRITIFYGPDLVYIHERERALQGIDLYIGDGASLQQSLVRKRGDRLIGHTAVRTQLTWCQKEGVRRAIITHCGNGIVSGDERKIGARIKEWGEERGVEAEIAYDGLELVLR